jgi:ATP diphosphatase
MAGVGQALPALSRAEKLGKRAARAGLDWPDARGVADKVREELDEVLAARSHETPDRIQEEIGDLLLACTSLARHCRVDPEEALRRACRKFETRFRRVEDAVRSAGLEWRNLTPEELDTLWQSTKAPG